MAKIDDGGPAFQFLATGLVALVCVVLPALLFVGYMLFFVVGE